MAGRAEHALVISASFKDFVAEQLSGLGPSIRPMFGGAGVFADGIMFALIHRDTLYLKAADRDIPAFEAEGSGPFTYVTSQGPHTLGSYWRVPERLFDEPEEMTLWARRALAAAKAGARRRGPARGARTKSGKSKFTGRRSKRER
jgi:DNA transformation protein